MSNLAAVKILQDLRANGLDLGFEEADYAAMDTAIEALSAFGVVIGRNTDSDGTDVFIVRTSTGETEYFVRATPASTKKRDDKLRERDAPEPYRFCHMEVLDSTHPDGRRWCASKPLPGGEYCKRHAAIMQSNSEAK